MRIVVVVDAYNLYYGERSTCQGRDDGWKWLDVGKLVERKVTAWRDGRVIDIWYCTALRGRTGAPESADQNCYLGALQQHDPRVKVRLGKYVRRNKPGALLDRAGREPVRWPDEGLPEWLGARQAAGPEGDPEVIVRVRTFEEKGSDVNVAVSLLEAVFTGAADAAIVVSNDSDLAEAVRSARRIVPVGVLNPTRRATAGDLQGRPDDGVGGHWWGRLAADDYTRSQMPIAVGAWTRPAGW